MASFKVAATNVSEVLYLGPEHLHLASWTGPNSSRPASPSLAACKVFLRPRIVVHDNLLDLEDCVLLWRSSSPTLVAVPENFRQHGPSNVPAMPSNLRPVVPHPVSVLRGWNIRLELILELVVQVESAGSAVPVDAVVVHR